MYNAFGGIQMDKTINQIIDELKEKAEAFHPCKDEAVSADHVVYGSACDLWGALGFFTPSSHDVTVIGCSRGKIYKKTPKNEYVTCYYLDADDRLIAISGKEHIDEHRTVIDYEDDVIYAFEWSMSEDREELECVTVCGCISGLVNSCLTIYTTVKTISVIYHDLYEYDAEGIVCKVKSYEYHVLHEGAPELPAEDPGLFPEDWDFRTTDKLYSKMKPDIEHEFTGSEAEKLMPFLTEKLGCAKPVTGKKSALSLSTQRPLYNALAESVSEEMSLDELICSFRKMLDSASRKDELLLFEAACENDADKQQCSLRLVRQIPDGAGEFIQLELTIDMEPADMAASVEFSPESEWFQASDDDDTTYRDKFIDHIRKSSAYQKLRDHKVHNAKAHLDRT